MRTVHYKSEDGIDSEIYAEPVADRESDADEAKLQDCIAITATYFNDSTVVYLTREDALHFAGEIKALAEAKPSTPAQ